MWDNKREGSEYSGEDNIVYRNTSSREADNSGNSIDESITEKKRIMRSWMMGILLHVSPIGAAVVMDVTSGIKLHSSSCTTK